MSYLLAALGLLSLYVGGQGKRWGWVLGILSQFVWAGYAVATNQLGFLVSACAYAAVYFINSRRVPHGV